MNFELDIDAEAATTCFAAGELGVEEI